MNTKSNMISQKKCALIAGTIIIIIFAVSLSAIYLTAGRTDCRYAHIYQNNKLIKTVDLSAVNEPYTFTVYYDDNEYNVLEVKNGSIGIIEASCPDKLCQNMGFISDSSLPVTCLPNHLVIKLSDDNEGDYDGIAY